MTGMNQEDSSDENRILYISQKRATIFTVFWILLCIVIGIVYHPKNPSWGDIGALMSGVFAPVVWIWFLASYAIQSSELSLQRKELTLQRKALETQVEELKHSVAAQRGSEIALTEQSKVLSKQLEATEKQFSLYLEEYEGKKPLFKYFQSQVIDIEHTGSGNKHESGFLVKITSMSAQFLIENIAGDCVLKSIELLNDPFAKYDEDGRFEVDFRLYDNSSRNSCDYYGLTIDIRIDHIGELYELDSYKLAVELLNAAKFNLRYSYSGSSSSDEYRLTITRHMNKFYYSFDKANNLAV